MSVSNLETMSVLSPHSLLGSDQFLAAIKLFVEMMPELTPEEWGRGEPTNSFDANLLEELVPNLAEHEKLRSALPLELQSNFPAYGGRPEPIGWTRKTWPKAYGHFGPAWGDGGQRATHSHIYVDIQSDAIGQDKMTGFLKDYCVKLDCDLGQIDILTPYYKDIAFRNGASQFSDHISFTTHVLRHWLPDVFWATVFGPAYVKLFGKENLLNAPAAVAQEIGENMIYIQLTDKLSDAVDHPEELNEVRKTFKKSQSVDAFYREDCGFDCHDILDLGIYGKIFSTPIFEFRQP